MAISIACPRCTHRQSFADEQAGKQVHCKICHHLLTVKAEPTAAPKRKSTEGGAATGVQARAPAAKAAPDEPEMRKPRRRAEEPDDEDDDLPARRPRRTEAESSVLMWSLIAGGGVLIVGVLALFGIVAYLLWPAGNANPPVAVAPVPAPAIEMQPIPPAFNNPVPPPLPNVPPPNFNPPPRGRLDPKNPAEADKVLAQLPRQGQEQNDAIDWLLHANPDHPKRAELARAMDGMVDDQLNKPFTDNFFRAYFRWATKDQYPTLIRFVENGRFTVWDNQRRHGAMQALGKLKDERAAPIIAGKLESFHDRGAAVNALTELGPAAGPAVLKYFHHQDRGLREAARDLLRRAGTKDDAYLEQTIADLGAAEEARRQSAVEWLIQAPVDEARKPEVARLLDRQLADGRPHFRQEPVFKALEKWGTTENVPKLIATMEQNKLGNQPIIRILGKLKDPRGLEAVAGRLGNLFDGREAHQALRDVGKDAEPAVVSALSSPDRKTRVAACRLLAEIGTRGSVPAIANAARQFPQDRELQAAAQAAAVAINNRPQ